MSHHLISTILRHDQKQNSYKIALIRALNDVVLSFPGLLSSGKPVAVPLPVLAEFWIAYYWPFVDRARPVEQGIRSLKGDVLRNDISFRPHLTELRSMWQRIHSSASPADGFHLVNEMRVTRLRADYPSELIRQYGRTISQIARAMRQPIKYAGPGEWQVFDRPQRFSELEDVVAVPGTSPHDVCLVVPAELWKAFREVSLWVEALCIHEWSLLTERFSDQADRGHTYLLLTERPGNRLPLEWERNRVNILMLEGQRFECPWTGRPLTPDDYQLDHIVPISVYPFNELWNLVPSDPRFNMHRKRNRLPSGLTMESASKRLGAVYSNYQVSPDLGDALSKDVASRFDAGDSPNEVVESVSNLVLQIGTARNLPTF